jgi:hypothetical protein
MTTIFERVETALGTLNPAVPYALAPYKGALPDLYITHQLVVGVPEQTADDAETERAYFVQISIFSRTGLASLPEVDTAMSAAGFLKGPERQLPQDPQTGHYGLAKEFTFV